MVGQDEIGSSPRAHQRQVPRSLRHLVFLHQAIPGWLFILFAAAFAPAIVPEVDASYPWIRYDRRAGVEHIHVEDVYATDDDGQQSFSYYRVSYSFVDQAHVEHVAASITDRLPEHLAESEAEYSAGDPSISRLVGMRRFPYSPWGLFALLPPLLIGALLLVRARRTTRRKCGLVASGLHTEATWLGPAVSDNEYDLEYVAAGRTYRTSVWRRRRPADGAEAAVLYDPREPQRCQLLDSFPGKLQISADNELDYQPGSFWLLSFPAVLLILIAITVVRLLVH